MRAVAQPTTRFHIHTYFSEEIFIDTKFDTNAMRYKGEAAF